MSSDSIKSKNQNIQTRYYEDNLNSDRFNYAEIIIPFSKFITNRTIYSGSNNFQKSPEKNDIDIKTILKGELK